MLRRCANDKHPSLAADDLAACTKLFHGRLYLHGRIKMSRGSASERPARLSPEHVGKPHFCCEVGISAAAPNGSGSTYLVICLRPAPGRLARKPALSPSKAGFPPC